MIKNSNLFKFFEVFCLIALMILSNHHWEVVKFLSIPFILIFLYLLSILESNNKSDKELISLVYLIISVSTYNAFSWGLELGPFMFIFYVYILLGFASAFLDTGDFFLKTIIIGLLYWFVAMAFRKLDVTLIGGIAIAFPVIWYIILNLFKEVNALLIALFGLIALLFLFSQVNDKEKTPIATEEEQKLEQKINEEEVEIKEAFVYHFDKLKQERRLSPRINPNFKMEQRIEGNKRIIDAEFSYDVIKEKKTTKGEQYENEIIDYGLGKYHLNVDESPGAYAMAQFVGIGVEKFLRQNLEDADLVRIQLHGYSDATQFDPDDPKIYDGQVDFSDYVNFAKYEKAINNYYLNNRERKLNLEKGDTIKNETLAFLRAFYLKHEYFYNNVDIFLEIAPKTHYTYHATTEKEDGKTGGEYRKSKVLIKIINTRLDGHERPEPSPIPSIDRCSNFLKILLFILGIISSAFLGIHYKRYLEKRDEGKDNKFDLIRVRLALFSIVILIIIFLWLCPNHLPFG